MGMRWPPLQVDGPPWCSIDVMSLMSALQWGQEMTDWLFRLKLEKFGELEQLVLNNFPHRS